MTELTQEQTEIKEEGVLGEAVIKKDATTEGAKKLRAIRDKEGPEEALEAYRSMKPIEELIGAGRLEKMGFERDPDGKKVRTGTEQTRFESANTESRIIELYLKEGFDGISDDASKKAIISAYERALVIWPEAAMLDESDRKEYIKRRLKDPKLAGTVREAYKNTIKLTDSFDESVTIAEEKFRKVEREELAARTRHETNRREQAVVDIVIGSFGRDASGNPNTKLKELEDIRIKVAADESLRSRLQREIDALNQEKILKMNLANNTRALALANTDAVAVGGEVTVLQGNIDIKQGEFDDTSRDIAKKDQLEGDVSTAESDNKRLEEEEVGLKELLDKATYELSTSRVIFEDAKNARGTQEEKFVADLKNVFLNAALEDVEGTIDEWEIRRSDRLKKLEEQIGDRAAKAILKSDRRWVKSTGTRPKDIKIKEKEIEDDYFVLLNEGGDALIKRILKGEMENGDRVFSDVEIEEKLADENFIKQVQPELIAQLLFRRNNAKKPNVREVEIIATSKWGEGMFEAAFEKDENVRRAIDKLKEDGKFSGSRMEFVRSMAKNPRAYGTLAGIIALILGAPFLAAGGLAAAGLYSKGLSATY